MKSTPESIRESQQALAHFLRQSRRDAGGGSRASFDVEDEAQHTPDEPAQRAAEYAKARNQNLRPVRQIDESNPAAVEGQRQALDWLARKGKSLVRK
jgi:hypothetical protein